MCWVCARLAYQKDQRPRKVSKEELEQVTPAKGKKCKVIEQILEEQSARKLKRS